MNTIKKQFPFTLLSFYFLVFILCAIDPFKRALWAIENIPPLLVVYLAVVVYKKNKFSNTALFLISFFVILQTIGSHYAFENVPFGWVTRGFGFERNHFDRLVHFSVGFFAFPIAEIVYRRNLTDSKWLLYLFSLFAVMFIASAYEILEWIYALIVADGDPEVLGMQGDIWDAQIDMALDFSGAVLALLIFKHKDKQHWKIRKR